MSLACGIQLHHISFCCWQDVQLHHLHVQHDVQSHRLFWCRMYNYASQICSMTYSQIMQLHCWNRVYNHTCYVINTMYNNILVCMMYIDSMMYGYISYILLQDVQPHQLRC